MEQAFVWMGDIIVAGGTDNGHTETKKGYVVASCDMHNLLSDSVTVFPITENDALPAGTWSNIHSETKVYRASWVKAQVIPKTAILAVIDKAIREDYIKLIIGKKKFTDKLLALS